MTRLAGKRIGLLSSWASPRNGGVWSMVLAQAEMLREAEATPVLFALDDGEPIDREAEQFEMHRAPVHGPDALGFAPGLLGLMLEANCDLMHLHGLWHYPGRAGALWAEQTDKPYLISPHGMLDPWIMGRNRWKKTLAMLAFERRNWAAATAFHALTGREAAQIGTYALDKPRCIIANPAPPIADPRAVMPAPQLLYLGRLHQKKNIAALLDAWDLARGDLPDDARLTLAGSRDASTDGVMAELAAQKRDDITVMGPVYGTQKQALIAQARFLILPSLSEGLPVTVLESWAAGTPTLMSEHCQLPQGFACGAAQNCGTDAQTIAQAMVKAFAYNADAWLSASRAARGLAVGEFASATIAQEWHDVYDAMLTGEAARDG